MTRLGTAAVAIACGVTAGLMMHVAFVVGPDDSRSQLWIDPTWVSDLLRRFPATIDRPAAVRAERTAVDGVNPGRAPQAPSHGSSLLCRVGFVVQSTVPTL